VPFQSRGPVVVASRIDQALHEAVKARGVAEDRSVSQLIRLALRQLVATQRPDTPGELQTSAKSTAGGSNAR
jgi:hypothetical protein